MFEFLKRKKQNFLDTARTVIDCQNGVFYSVFQQLPYVLVFKTTNWCWNNCAHCCENSGSHMPKSFISESVIKEYIDQACQDKKFGREIVFTGGEITSSYKFAGEDYIKNILNHALNAKCGVDIKTNAGWVNTKLAPKIYSDMEQIVRSQSENANGTGIKHIAKLQISLSLDRFHKDSLGRDFKFLEHFAHTDIPGIAFIISISSFNQDRHMFHELMQQLAQSGIKTNEMFMISSQDNKMERMYDLNGNTIVKYTEGTLFNGGRAKDIDSAYKTPCPQFTFLNSDYESLIAFDSFGNVTLGENSGKKISVPWRDPKSGQPLSLQTIKENLVSAIKSEEQDFLRQHKKMNAYFNWTRRKFCR